MKFRSRPTLALAVLAAASLIVLVARASRHPRPPGAGQHAALSALAPPQPSAAPGSVQRITVPLPSNFARACAQLHLAPQLTNALVRSARPVYNLGRIQAGHVLTAVRTASGELQALSYQIDAAHRLWLRAPAHTPAATALPQPRWTASIQAIPYLTRLVGVSGTLRSSLFQAMEEAGERDRLALSFASIFSWDVDFNTETRPTDVFRVLVQKEYRNGKFSQYGHILAAEYVNGGHVYEALRFRDRHGIAAYYRPNGQPLKREFLSSPLPIPLRVTSAFSEDRFHPILKIYRPHLGVDFGAPMGTPVEAIGAGVVIRAGWQGEDGNMVQLRHPNGFDTLYLHLSRILVHVGQRVAQGQRIGLVGMTGLATGPHLDFRIEQHGEFENFMTVRKQLPPGRPVPPNRMARFRQLRAQYMPELASLKPRHPR